MIAVGVEALDSARPIALLAQNLCSRQFSSHLRLHLPPPALWVYRSQTFSRYLASTITTATVSPQLNSRRAALQPKLTALFGT